MAKARLITVTLSAAIDRVIEAPGFATGKPGAYGEVARIPAGKGFNVARGLAALGDRCVAAGLVGKAESQWFGEGLRRGSGGRIRPQLVLVEGSTRECLTIRDPIARTESHLRGEPPELNTADAERLVALVASRVNARSIVALCGSAPPGAGLACFLTLLSECRARRARIVVDSSGAALSASRADAMWMLKINDEELAALTKKPTSTLRQVVAAGRPLCADGSRSRRIVIVTRGRHGAVLLTPRGATQARTSVAPKRILGTIGCGDAFLAGLLSAKARGRTWSDSLRLGVASATALAVSETPGAFTLNEAMMFLKHTTAESL